MTRILLVGYNPETVDFSDPALPPGMTAEKVRAGIAVALKQFAERGWEADVGFIRPDETAGPTVERQLASTTYDCVVIGAGVRLPPRRLALFEAVINAVHKAAPGAAIAFNTRPEDSADAAARWLPVGSRAVNSGTQQDQTTASDKPRPWARPWDWIVFLLRFHPLRFKSRPLPQYLAPTPGTTNDTSLPMYRRDVSENDAIMFYTKYK
jgi:hypothetical protein